MNCKYCGAALPTQGGVCPGCGKMIPISQQKEMKEMLDPRWNEYRNINSTKYKSETAYDSNDKIGKIIIIVIVLIILLIIFLTK